MPIETPFGNIVSPNITPDRNTGIGAWTEGEFLIVMQEGIGRGGEQLYPVMPYTYYTKTTREDVLAIRACLQILEPVHNAADRLARRPDRRSDGRPLKSC